MNEVTKIHLGRQAFTISIDAQRELNKYLEEISKQVRDEEVEQEIELRMAELLVERGIKESKVVLPSDIKYLKTQLGNPKDFKEEDDETPAPTQEPTKSKRLFRDTDNALLAGVASGLSQYLGLDALLVRIIFIVFIILTAGWGILVYIVLWLLVPEAKTSSDKLQMAGKPVNVDSLKEIAANADLKGAAKRASGSLAEPINTLFRCLIKVAGVVFVVFGLGAIFSLITAESYLLINHSAWSRYSIFPVGFREYLLLDIVMVTVALIATFVIFFGIAMFRRKWPIRSWVTGILVGLILIGFAVGGALTADVYPTVHNRYEQGLHSSTRTLKPFSSLEINGPINNVNIVYGNSYRVSLGYYGQPNLSQVQTTVQNSTLIVNTNQFDWHRNCQSFCIPNSYNLNITVYSPDANALSNKFYLGAPAPPKPYWQ